MFASLGATSSFSSGDLATIIEKCSVASNRRDQVRRLSPALKR